MSMTCIMNKKVSTNKYERNRNILEEAKLAQNVFVDISVIYPMIPIYIRDQIISYSYCCDQNKIDNKYNESGSLSEINTLLSLSLLRENFFLTEYVFELDWLRSHLTQVNASNDNLEKEKKSFNESVNEFDASSSNLYRKVQDMINDSIKSGKNQSCTSPLYCSISSLCEVSNARNSCGQSDKTLNSVILIPQSSMENKSIISFSKSSDSNVLTTEYLECPILSGDMPPSTESTLVECHPMQRKYREVHHSQAELESQLDSVRRKRNNTILSKNKLLKCAHYDSNVTKIHQISTSSNDRQSNDRQSSDKESTDRQSAGKQFYNRSQRANANELNTFKISDENIISMPSIDIENSIHIVKNDFSISPTHSFTENGNSRYSYNLSKHVNSIDMHQGSFNNLLFMDPIEQLSFSAFSENIHNLSPTLGSSSPLSPLVHDQPSSKGHLSFVSRNCRKMCPIHRLESSYEESSINKNNVKPSGWSWDQDEPLNIPALCSCRNETLYKIWQFELNLHKTYCSQSIRHSQSDTNMENTVKYNLDWNAIRNGDFSQFIRSDSQTHNEYDKSTYCHICGGLTYIPFSFIEITLNRDINTIQDIARHLPLPVSTYFYCDGLRVTTCLVSRCLLHEWLILKSLKFIGIESSIRIYQVCSYFIHPFSKINNSNQSPQSDTNIMCSRHNLYSMHTLSKYPKSHTYQLVSISNRRPYCLRYKDKIPDALIIQNINSEKLLILRNACFKWLNDCVNRNK